MTSLFKALRHAPDPRYTQYRTAAVLALMAMALLGRAARDRGNRPFCDHLDAPTTPLKKGTRAFYKVSGYGVFYLVITRMDPEAFAVCLTSGC